MREELVDFDVVVELWGAGERERVRMAPFQFAALDALQRSYYVRAGLVEYPVVGRGTGAGWRCWPEAVEHERVESQLGRAQPSEVEAL